MPTPTIHDIENSLATLHNLGHSLAGNTQASDLDWFAALLFENSRLGVGDACSIPWLLDREEWKEVSSAITPGSELQPQGLFNPPFRFEQITPEQQEAWRKLARICLYCLPRITDRIASRYINHSLALKEEWNRVREEESAIKKA